MSEDERRLLDDNEVQDELDAIDQDGFSQPILARSSDVTSRFDVRLAIAFTIMGAGMLWPFNSLITANEFFGQMFRDNRQISAIYSQSITFLFTLTNLGSVLYFTKTVRSANLNTRISRAAIATTFLFGFLAVLTTADLHAEAFFVLLMISVAITGVSTGALQNGCFGIVGQYHARCVPFLMIGQGIAGVMPATISIVVALLGGGGQASANRRAFAYFLSSSMVLASAYTAHLYLLTRPDAPKAPDAAESSDSEATKYAELLRSYHPWSIFITFAITLAIFPSVTASVVSVLPTEEGVPFEDVPKMLQPAIFIPLGFLLWNAGDLLARCLTVFPTLTFESPRLLFAASLARVLWIPAIYLCNVHGSGAIIKSDAFFFAYMTLFGMSNGFLGSLVMAAAIKQAKPSDKRGMGAFMSLMLCSGLVAGSLLSFAF